MIIKQIISVEDWGSSTLKERQINLNKISLSFIYWDYIQAFDKVLYFNNEKHKHKWFIKEYDITPQKGVIVDSSVRHIARKISIQDGDKEAMINNYLEEVKRGLLLNISQYEKSDTSMGSERSEDATDDIQEAQPIEATTEDTLRKAENFLQKLKEKDKL
ncbi:hypothetical protein H5410_051002 [Solanum commersonii]|uniref:Uncharacterized protein n=1 Tax=Solanum commersonii TaxID=4109 RepID=A0A9J5WYD0_SOLCO|nr:hypothetical protein H5410_051002 [Solanum commersonii]